MSSKDLKNSNKNTIKAVVGSAILVTPLSLSSVSFAIDKDLNKNELIKGDGYTVNSIIDTENNTSMKFDFEHQNESVNLTINHVDEENSEVNVLSSTGESHTLTYNKNDSFAIMDGEKVYYIVDEFVDEDELRMSEYQASKYRNAYSPVYVSSGSINVSKNVSSVATLVTVIGGAIVLAKWAGVKIASSVIAGKIGDWCSVVGLGTLWAASRFDGKITYKLYRSKSPIQPPLGAKQIGYRYQDIRAIGKVKGKSMNIQLKSTGSWWFGNKPN